MFTLVINPYLFLIVLLLPMFVVMNIVCYYLAWWLDRKDRITLSVSKTFMNGSLALVLASQFFGPEAVLVVVANIPLWYVYLGLAKRFIKQAGLSHEFNEPFPEIPESQKG